MKLAWNAILGLFKRPVVIARLIRYMVAVGTYFKGLDHILGAATTISIVMALLMRFNHDRGGRNAGWAARMVGWALFLSAEALCALALARELHKNILDQWSTSVPLWECVLGVVYLATLTEIFWQQFEVPSRGVRVIDAKIRFEQSLQRIIPFQVLGTGLKDLQMLISTNDYSLQFLLVAADHITVLRFACIDGTSERHMELVPGNYELHVQRDPQCCKRSRLHLRGWVQAEDEDTEDVLDSLAV